MKFFSMTFAAATLLSGLCMITTQAAAFEMDACDTVLRGENVPEDVGPEGPVDFFIEPGLAGGALECILIRTGDAPWDLEVYEPVPSEVDTLFLGYLQDQIQFLVQAQPGGQWLTLADCTQGDGDTATFVTCTTHLTPQSGWLSYVVAFDANLAPLSYAVQMNMWRFLADPFSRELPEFYQAPADDRTATLFLHDPDDDRTADLTAQDADFSWVLELTDAEEIYRFAEHEDMVEFFSIIDGPDPYELVLRTEMNMSTDTPTARNTFFEGPPAQAILAYGRNLENTVLAVLREAAAD